MVGADGVLTAASRIVLVGGHGIWLGFLHKVSSQAPLKTLLNSNFRLNGVNRQTYSLCVAEALECLARRCDRP